MELQLSTIKPSNLFSGGGANGGNAGCNGGGGGGGGAGCASSSYTGTGGGKGGGGGGPAGHGGGKGGGRGMTSYKSNLFDLVSQNSNNSGGGYTAYSYHYRSKLLDTRWRRRCVWWIHVHELLIPMT